MDKNLREILRQHKHDLPSLYQQTGIGPETTQDYILRETEITISEGEHNGTWVLCDFAMLIEDL